MKTAYITGASSGIGRATAMEFARNGYRIILAARRREKLEFLSQTITGEYKVPCLVQSYDLRDFKACQKAISALGPSWKDVDVLVNNAGLAKGLATIDQGDIDHWDQMIDTNVKGVLHVSRCISPFMVKRQSGHIINVCSIAGKEVYPKGNVYCASKHAVDALTKAMRIDLCDHGIRVSQISPAHVEDNEFALVRFSGDKEKAKIYNDFNPLRSEDVARSIFFIASQPPHVNIQDILIMGTQQANANYINRSGRIYDTPNTV